MLLFRRHHQEVNLTVINFARLLFFGLFIFELLNYLHILEFNTQFTWLGLVITSAVAFILLEAIAYHYKKIKGRRLHWIFWLIIVVALSLDAFGDFFHLYGGFEWWDQFVHYSVSAIIFFTLFSVISFFWVDKFKFSLLMKAGRLKLALLLASATTMSLSALYEIEEYIEDLIFHTNRSGPGTDTANDLLFNFLGILTTVAFIYFYYLITHKREVIE
jgi:uncharacterized membrane protein YjdF